MFRLKFLTDTGCGVMPLVAAIFLALSVSVIAVNPAQAQRMGIIATVNNTPISEFDLHARLKLIIALSGLPSLEYPTHPAG